MGETGRPPDGPRRISSVVPTPTATPIRAAVSKSYCSSEKLSRIPLDRSSPSTPARTDPRARDIVLGRRGVAVVAIVHLLLGFLYRTVELELFELGISLRKLRPIVRLGNRRRARPHPSYRGCGRNEHLLGFLLDDFKERVEVAEPPLGHRHGVL